MALRERSPFEFLERIYSSGYGRSHVGFKIFAGENDVILDHLIRDNDVRKIVLYRRNILAAFSSHLVAGRTGKYSASQGAERGESPKVRFQIGRFAKYHHNFTSFYRDTVERLNRHRQNYYFCSYEEINDPWMQRNLVSFIGADPNIPISPDVQLRHQVKQNTSDIVSRFQNRKDVVQFLKTYGLSHWAHEGELSLAPFAPAEHDEPSSETAGRSAPGEVGART
jgi:hypothetical protein